VSGYVLAGLIAGAVLVVVHVMRRRGRPAGPRLERGVELVLYGQAVAAGVRLIVLAITKKHLGPLSEEDRVYIVIGGLALIWIAIGAIAREFRTIPTQAQAVVPPAPGGDPPPKAG
jgi:hypothetical protein